MFHSLQFLKSLYYKKDVGNPLYFFFLSNLCDGWLPLWSFFQKACTTKEMLLRIGNSSRYMFLGISKLQMLLPYGFSAVIFRGLDTLSYQKEKKVCI